VRAYIQRKPTGLVGRRPPGADAAERAPGATP
jgi:hypothetical protein